MVGIRKTYSFSYGIILVGGVIMESKQIVLVANGKNKAAAIKAALEGQISPLCQASILKLHPNVTFILDEDAASALTEYKAI